MKRMPKRVANESVSAETVNKKSNSMKMITILLANSLPDQNRTQRYSHIHLPPHGHKTS